MTTKHTPGPWWFEGPDEFGDYNIHHPDDRLAVAAVVSNGRPDNEISANARLAAAAPNLLEFAKYVADLDPGNEAPLFAAARAAIAKAEGSGR